MKYLIFLILFVVLFLASIITKLAGMAFVFFLKSLNITNLERGDLKINDFLIGSLASSSAVSLLIALCAVSLLGLFCNEVNSEGQQ